MLDQKMQFLVEVLEPREARLLGLEVRVCGAERAAPADEEAAARVVLELLERRTARAEEAPDEVVSGVVLHGDAHL